MWGTQWAGSNQEGEGKILISTMTIRGLVDWRGNPINTEVHGGVRAAWFIYCKCLYSSHYSLFPPSFLNYECNHLHMCARAFEFEVYFIFILRFHLFPTSSSDGCSKHRECPKYAEYGHLSPWNNAYGSVEICNYSH